LKKVLKLERDSNRTALLLPRCLKQGNWSWKCWKSLSACWPPTLPLQQLWWHPQVPCHASRLHLRIWMSTWRPQRLERWPCCVPTTKRQKLYIQYNARACSHVGWCPPRQRHC